MKCYPVIGKDKWGKDIFKLFNRGERWKSPEPPGKYFTSEAEYLEGDTGRRKELVAELQEMGVPVQRISGFDNMLDGELEQMIRIHEHQEEVNRRRKGSGVHYTLGG